MLQSSALTTRRKQLETDPALQDPTSQAGVVQQITVLQNTPNYLHFSRLSQEVTSMRLHVQTRLVWIALLPISRCFLGVADRDSVALKTNKLSSEQISLPVSPWQTRTHAHTYTNIHTHTNPAADCLPGSTPTIPHMSLKQPNLPTYFTL